MKYIIGSILMIIGVVLGIYVGVWLCLIGGLMGIVSAIGMMSAGLSFPTTLVSISILKIFLSSLAGWLSASIFIFPAFAVFPKK